MTHGIWSFLSDNTVCGKPVEQDITSGHVVMKNVALELEDITCPTCKSKLEVAQRATA